MGLAVEAWGALGLRQFPWRSSRDPYRTIIVEVLLQQTPAGRVADFYDAFFARYPDWSALATAPEEELQDCLRPLGLYRRRASALRNLALSVLDAREVALPDRPGIGQYVDRAVAVTLEGARVAMVDTNFVRVLARVFEGPWMSDYRYDKRLQQLASEMILACSDARITNWAVLDLAATVCRPARPLCGQCPLLTDCGFGMANVVGDVTGGPGA